MGNQKNKRKRAAADVFKPFSGKRPWAMRAHDISQRLHHPPHERGCQYYMNRKQNRIERYDAAVEKEIMDSEKSIDEKIMELLNKFEPDIHRKCVTRDNQGKFCYKNNLLPYLRSYHALYEKKSRLGIRFVQGKGLGIFANESIPVDSMKNRVPLPELIMFLPVQVNHKFSGKRHKSFVSYSLAEIHTMKSRMIRVLTGPFSLLNHACIEHVNAQVDYFGRLFCPNLIHSVAKDQEILICYGENYSDMDYCDFCKVVERAPGKRRVKRIPVHLYCDVFDMDSDSDFEC